MCIRSSSPHKSNGEYKYVFEQFMLAEYNYGVKELSIAYLAKSMDISEDQLYESIHHLLELGVVGKLEYTECPYCMHEDKHLKIANRIKCSRCKEIYIYDFTIEKFILENCEYVDEE